MDIQNLAAKVDYGHRRFNPLINQWVLVSPNRLLRPWDGLQTPVSFDHPFPEVDPENPLLPSAVRSNGELNPNYEGVYVFNNDFSALKTESPTPDEPDHPLFRMSEARGTCRVICYTPKSDTTMGVMPIQDIFRIIDVWIEEMVGLGEFYDWVQIFENKGLLMGCSNPHPHGQIWACSFLPTVPELKNEAQLKYFEKYNRPMLMDYAKQEIEKKERVILINNEWIVVIPFWATWPFETLILPRTHVRRFYDLNHDQKVALADILRKLNVKYDNLFNIIFPYSMGWHGAPTGKYKEQNMDHWVFHGMYYPPLLRSATVVKHMVGFEMLCEAQRDITPEMAAVFLRAASDVHFITKPLPNKE